jgi:hypothetical protein
MTLKTVTLSAAACALLGLGGCVSTRSTLSSDADRLEHNANALARETQDLPSGADYPDSYARDARQLADDSREFRHVVESHDATDADVKASFKRVSRSYLLVRDEVEHSDSREARSDLKPVTDAYLDVEREMGGYPVHHASAYD